MKKPIKMFISLLLCVLLVPCFPTLSFAEASSAKLKNIYGDGMLFKQNDTVVFAGTGTAGADVSCVLEDESGETCINTSAVINAGGEFRLSFTAPAGGYREYKVTFFVDGNEFRVLSDIVFGELWLASGQSNMQYSLNQSDTYEQNKTGSEWLRFFYIDPYPTYNGNSEEFPLEAQNDIEQGCCRWMKGTDNDLGNISAVSFFFAQELEKELGMPIGVLMPNLGGSMLASWLSREAIDSDPVFAEYLKQEEMYVAEQDWDSSAIVWYSTMTSNYNKKIKPLCDFSIAGMIWYQGESEILTTWDIGPYERGLTLLQSSYGKLFGCDGKLPFIATQVAPYAYGDNRYNLHNNEFIDFQLADSSSRAVTTIYDLSLNYIPQMGLIHPGAKQPVGERLAACAKGLVYGSSPCYTAATPENAYQDGSDFYVTLRNVGDGLACDESFLKGFALCEEGGVYVQAEAEIVNDDTIRIYSNEVKSPVAATYAFAKNNNSANVYSTLNGDLFLPIAPFSTDIENDKLYWESPSWANCDTDRAWLLSGDSQAGENSIWAAENAQITVDSTNQFAGDGCINVTSDEKAGKFSISPVFTYTKDKEEEFYDGMLTDWDNYCAVSVMIRNNGERDVTLEGMRIYTKLLTWYAPQIGDSGEACEVIPADGQWHKITFDLNSLYLFGNECGASYSRRQLDEIKSFEINFNDTEKLGSDISIDEIRFTADASDGKRMRFDTNLKNADNLFEFISALFVVLIGAIINAFTCVK